MKKITLSAIVATVLLTFTSCKKDIECECFENIYFQNIPWTTNSAITSESGLSKSERENFKEACDNAGKIENEGVIRKETNCQWREL